MYSDHLQNKLDFDHGMLIFFILAPFRLSQTGQMCSFQAFSWQGMGGMGPKFVMLISILWYPENEKGKF